MAFALTGGDPRAFTLIIGAKARFFRKGAVDTTGEALVAANPDRRLGVFVRNSNATNAAKVGETAALITAGAYTDIDNKATGLRYWTFIPGTGAVFGVAAAGTADLNGWEI